MNPDIAKAGEATQLGKPGGPKRGHEKAWSIRSQMRYIAAQQIDVTAPGALEELFGKKPTNAQRAAFNAILKTVKDEGDIRAIEIVDDRIDGKLPQTNINAEFAAIHDMTDDELRTSIASKLARIENLGSADAGSPAPGDNVTVAESAPASDTAAEVPRAMDTQTT